MEGQNHYIVLGVPVDASEAQIKSAYRAQMKKHHPDRNSGDPEATRISKEINKAHETLSDPVRRFEFDLRAAMTTQEDLPHRGGRASKHSHTQRHRASTPGGQTGTTSPETISDRPRRQSRHTPVSVLEGVVLALLVGVVRVVEFLSIPVSMIGIGGVLVAWGSFMTASVAMNFILTALIGVPAVIVGLLLLIGAREGWLAILGVVVAVAGVGFTLYGAFMTVTAAPIPVLMTLLGAGVFSLGVHVGLDQSSFTSRGVKILP